MALNVANINGGETKPNQNNNENNVNNQWRI
jgi:hypothetical protein